MLTGEKERSRSRIVVHSASQKLSTAAEEIRSAVREFASRNGFDGRGVEHAFTPWYLCNRFRMAPQEAILHSSDGSADHGLDGFFLDGSQGARTLWLIQAKMTDSYQGIVAGVQDLARAIDALQDLIVTGDTLRPSENRVIRQLRSALNSLGTVVGDPENIKCQLLHLVEADRETWRSRPKLREAEELFNKSVRLAGVAGRVELDYVGPDEMTFSSLVVPKAADPTRLRFQGMPVELAQAHCHFGLGHLADLVQMYDKYRTDLFAKNVRMYLYRATAQKEQGAARQIRQSLDAICKGPSPGSMTPDHFALMHNGVTIWARGAVQDGDGRMLLDPGADGIFVLNGCQTIYTAWDFYEKTQAKDPEWHGRWQAIRVPVRILVTDDDQLSRDVTVSTNRQNQMPPSAFWAHDRVQLHIEEQLQRYRIFYERQEGAFEHRKRADLKNMEKTYDLDNCINMVQLARVIAAGDKSIPLSFAASPLRIFESTSQYKRVFSEQHLAHPAFLILLVNLFTAVRLALRDISDAGEASPLRSIKSGSLSIPAFRLLVQYVAWGCRRNRLDLSDIEVAAASVLGSKTGDMRQVKEWTRKQLRSQNSGIQQLLVRYWYDEEDEKWKEYTDNKKIKAAMRSHWSSVDVFEGWDELEAQASQMVVDSDDDRDG